MVGQTGANGASKRGRLVERRKALGLTQEDVAELLGVERTTVARWERGAAGPLPWLRPRLAKVLNVSPERIEVLLYSASSGPGEAAPAVPRQLPAAVPDFTGRSAELQALTRLLDETGARVPGTVAVSAIVGSAGIGKTALALHWAHQVADRFGDGQLHVNLRGFDPGGTPVTPADAIRGFLDALGVPPERVPLQPDAQAGLYRSLLANRRMLIVLDNACDEEQVRPLLPASPGSLVLVTSRSQLAGLAAAEGARLLSLDVMTRDEALALLTGLLGTARVAAEPAALDEIISRCACLPLALRVAAARAASQPGFPLAALAAELGGEGGRLDALDAGDSAASVRAVFSWSYQQLSTQAARMFRLLGLEPAPDINVPAAASLAGTTETEARRLLRELARANLITERVPGQYACHDLLRAYAADQARDSDSEVERHAAVSRIVDHYVQAASRATLVLDPARWMHGQLGDYEQAREYSRLALTLNAEAGNRQVDAGIWDSIGYAEHHLGNLSEAIACYQRSLGICRELGWREGEAAILTHLGDAHHAAGEVSPARECWLQALAIFEDLRHPDADKFPAKLASLDAGSRLPDIRLARGVA